MRWGDGLLIISVLPSFVFCQLPSEDHKFIKVPGVIMVGGLFPVHGNGEAQGRACGDIKEDKGIQRLEAMLAAIDAINKDPNFLPNVKPGIRENKLGVHILDTCSQDAYALEQTMEFIKSAIKTTANTGQYECAVGDVIYTKPKPTIAVIGAASSSVSAMVANMLRLFEIPQISYSSTSADLSDKSKFEYFSRVVPSDSLQAQAMVDLVEHLNWTYVHALFDEGTYGEKGIDSFKKLASQRGICLATSQKIKSKYQDSDFDDVIKKMMVKKYTKGVVMFVNEDSVRKVLRATARERMKDTQGPERVDYVWIASDSWGTKRAVVEERGLWNEAYGDAAHGAITIEPKKTVVKAFDDHFVKLNYTNNARNKWFHEFWTKKFNCSNCPGDLRETHRQESYVPFVYDSVFVLAHALTNMIWESCGDRDFVKCGLEIEGKSLLEHIRNVSFTSIQGTKVVLDDKGDRIGEYNVFQYNNVDKEYIQIGEWVEGLIISNTSNNTLVGTEFGGDIPRSYCSPECAPKTQYKVFVQDLGRCCWFCRPCNESSILPNDTSCIPCRLGFLPNSHKNECLPMIPETLEWTSLWAIVPAAFAMLGILATCVVIYTFVKYNKTPVIMASGRELCYFMISGILCSYCMTFVLVNPPSPLTCGILRLGLGLFMCTIYAAILTKTSRLARVFTGEIKTVQRPRFITPKAQVGICALIISVQLVGAMIWMAVDPPQTINVYPSRLRAVLSCRTTATPLLLSLGYDMILIILCTVYAFKTRKIPENFNETKYIGFTMYATCIVWLAFVPIYFATHHNFRIQTTSLCMCISISGTVTLCCFFAPKVYIVLFQPYKNVRERAMTNFQKLVAHHMNTQMRFVKAHEMDRPVESQVSQVTHSLISSTSATPETRSEALSRDDKFRGGNQKPGKPNGSRTLAPPSLSPMPESTGSTVDCSFMETAEIAPTSSTDLDPSEDVPFLDKDRESSVGEVDTGDEFFRDSPDIHKKESWVVADARAEVELILSEIATQEGTVV